VGSIAETFRKYPNTGVLLPAMGYGPKQVRDLQDTINRVPCDAVVIGTPIDLRRIVSIDKPSVRVQYSLAETGKPDLPHVLRGFMRKLRIRPGRRPA
jgi:predicted GTPase